MTVRPVSVHPQEENPDLFHSVFWSYGTLGFLTAVQVRIVRTKPYVRLQYRPAVSRDQLTELLTQVSGGQHQFVETLVYDRDRAVVMTGDFVSHEEVIAEPDKVSVWSGGVKVESGQGQTWVIIRVIEVMSGWYSVRERENKIGASSVNLSSVKVRVKVGVSQGLNHRG